MSECNVTQQELFSLARKKEPAQSANCTSSNKNTFSTFDDNTIIVNCQEKLDKEYKEAKKLSNKASAVGPYVLEALKDFVSQNTEFAQAIMQSDKSVSDCIEYTVKGCGNSISDLDVYKKSVEFYFTGATVHMTLTIDLGDDGFSNTSYSSSVDLNLDRLLNF